MSEILIEDFYKGNFYPTGKEESIPVIITKKPSFSCDKFVNIGKDLSETVVHMDYEEYTLEHRFTSTVQVSSRMLKGEYRDKVLAQARETALRVTQKMIYGKIQKELGKIEGDARKLLHSDEYERIQYYKEVRKAISEIRRIIETNFT